jgi:hypothetical protein
VSSLSLEAIADITGPMWAKGSCVRGRPSRKPLVRYKSYSYRAASWAQLRRIVAKVEHHTGELFPRVGFIITSLSLPRRAVVRFYNKRGTAEQWIAEQWIKEGKQAAHSARLSCHRFRSNEVRLQSCSPTTSGICGDVWCCRSASTAGRLPACSKTGGRLVNHARYHWPRWRRVI